MTQDACLTSADHSPLAHTPALLYLSFINIALMSRQRPDHFQHLMPDARLKQGPCWWGSVRFSKTIPCIVRFCQLYLNFPSDMIFCNDSAWKMCSTPVLWAKYLCVMWQNPEVGVQVIKQTTTTKRHQKKTRKIDFRCQSNFKWLETLPNTLGC